MALYLIKRGPRPDYHKAPFHPVILCATRKIAREEAGWTGDGAWVWERNTMTESGEGWLLSRWNGLDIDYGHLVRGHNLPDGSHTAFWRDYDLWPKGVQDLFAGAVWWSTKLLPAWLAKRGVVYPPDAFSRTDIVDAELDNGIYGMERRDQWPAWWGQEIP